MYLPDDHTDTTPDTPRYKHTYRIRTPFALRGQGGHNLLPHEVALQDAACSGGVACGRQASPCEPKE